MYCADTSLCITPLTITQARLHRRAFLLTDKTRIKLKALFFQAQAYPGMHYQHQDNHTTTE